jgi:hypothetical protein
MMSEVEKAPVVDLKLVAKAREFAAEMHKGQTDKLEEPYYNHLVAVSQGVRLLGGSLEEIAAAFLHDVVEDVSKVTFKSLLDEGFPAPVVLIVWAVTKKPQEEQGKYLDRIVAAGPGAMRVKVADLLHNLRPDRLAKLPDFTRVRLQAKYRPSLARLMMELSYLQPLEEQDQKLSTKPVGSAWSGGDYYYGSYGSKADIEPGQTLGTSHSFYTAAQLITGDWPAGLSAPIKSGSHVGGVGDRVFTLEDGTVWPCTYKGSMRTWSRFTVGERRKKEPNWSPAQEVMVVKNGAVQTTVKQVTDGKKK